MITCNCPPDNCQRERLIAELGKTKTGSRKRYKVRKDIQDLNKHCTCKNKAVNY